MGKTTDFQSAAKQAAHDLRSPLTALKILVGTLGEVSASKRQLIQEISERIGEIADDLLKTSRHSRAVVLSKLMERTLRQKLIEFGGRVEIRADTEGDLSGALTAPIDEQALGRIFSNLINNAVESMPTQVQLRLNRSAGFLVCEIEDDGKGIPPHISRGLGRQGFTFGKRKGKGLGLFHAKTTVESWGGIFEIKSAPGVGTVVRLSLPAAGINEA